MWNEPSPEVLRRLPPLYATEHTDWPVKLIYEHLFLGGCDWYLAEYDPQERVFFGFAILNGDLASAEWGYVGLDELRSINIEGIEVDRDLNWTPCPAGAVRSICLAHRRDRARGGAGA